MESISIYLNLKYCTLEKDNSRNDYKMKVGIDLVNVQTFIEEKDLDVTFDNLLKFDVHFQNVVSKQTR